MILCVAGHARDARASPQPDGLPRGDAVHAAGPGVAAAAACAR